MLAELEEVLTRPKFHAVVAEGDAGAYADASAAEAVLVADPENVERVTADPDDDYLVALAAAAGADALGSGDVHLAELVDAPVSVLTPGQFLERLEHA